MALEKILDSKTKINILKLLIHYPQQDFYGSELAKKINVSQAALSQQIKFLVEEKLLKENKRGKMKFYKLAQNKKVEIIKQLLKFWESRGA